MAITKIFAAILKYLSLIMSTSFRAMGDVPGKHCKYCQLLRKKAWRNKVTYKILEALFLDRF